ncbi:sugar ABC transporter substrate-binding protein [Aquibacillus sediminis]|uniref:sugar ABC transporter substrate-binding protein n=1 Tax=Aquibacillus sediminis TaxID=2574734 RepID=UPI001108C0B6|nr:substrate-binding domain-containing protein [Aquibacillus sediminis]
MQFNISKIFVLSLVLLLPLVFVGCTNSSSQPDKETKTSQAIKNTKLTTGEEKPYIGFVLDTLEEERWYKDKEQFEEKVNELGGNAKTLAANGNEEIQLAQAELLIEEGVDVLVVVPYNADAASAIVEMAHENDTKVISYDRLITNANVDYYISFDNEKVGELQAAEIIKHKDEGNFAYVGGAETDNNAVLVRKGAMNVLQPLIDQGKINLIYDNFTDGWDPQLAEDNIRSVLNEAGEPINAVVTANDGMAGGVINALTESDLAGDTPVSGQDASLRAIQRVVEGTQTMTVYKPINKLASRAAEIAIQTANRETVATDTTIDNGMVEVPTILLDPVTVTSENIDDTIIKDNYLTEEEIYEQ